MGQWMTGSPSDAYLRMMGRVPAMRIIEQSMSGLSKLCILVRRYSSLQQHESQLSLSEL